MEELIWAGEWEMEQRCSIRTKDSQISRFKKRSAPMQLLEREA